MYRSANRVPLSPHFLSVREYLGHVIFSFPFYVQLFIIVCNNICNNLQYVLDMDGLKTRRPFDVKRAADSYRKHVKEQYHLAQAYLVSIIWSYKILFSHLSCTSLYFPYVLLCFPFLFCLGFFLTWSSYFFSIRFFFLIVRFPIWTGSLITCCMQWTNTLLHLIFSTLSLERRHA